jgi:hypothetical protein
MVFTAEPLIRRPTGKNQMISDNKRTVKYIKYLLKYILKTTIKSLCWFTSYTNRQDIMMPLNNLFFPTA